MEATGLQQGVRHSRLRDAAEPRHLVAGCLALALAFSLAAPLSAASANGAERSPSASAAKHSKAKKRLTKRQRAHLKRLLLRQVKGNPRVVSRRSFLRRAALVNFKLPVTVRLRSACPAGPSYCPGDNGTNLEVTWLSIRRPLDNTTYPPPATQTLAVTGQFAMEMEFGSSAGSFGSMPSRTGHNIRLSSADPLRVAEYGDCGEPPPDPRPAFVEKTPGTNITTTTGGLSWTLTNPFSGSAEGDLYMKLNLRSRVRRSSSTCPSPGDFADFDQPAAPTGAEPWAQPMRLQWAGRFRIAPAVTADGRLRLGKIQATEPSQLQPVTTGNIWACAPSAVLTGPTVPAANDCSEVGVPLVPAMEPVGAAPFPAQLHLTSFNADVMVGDVPLP